MCALDTAFRSCARGIVSALPRHAVVDAIAQFGYPFAVLAQVEWLGWQGAEEELQPGTRVYLNWTSANRDETVFEDPDAYRPHEHAANNLVYGAGVHVCPGRPLATLELVVATQALLTLTSRVELAAEALPERETYPVGGWRRLPIRLH